MKMKPNVCHNDVPPEQDADAARARQANDFMSSVVGFDVKHATSGEKAVEEFYRGGGRPYNPEDGGQKK